MTNAQWDAHAMIAYRTPTQRYSASKDQFVTLNIEGEWYVMQCGASENRIARAATTVNRLSAHWQGFCDNHNAT